MPIVKKCSRCGVTILLPTVQDGKCFCSPECEQLFEDPDILKKIEMAPASEVRKHAAITFAGSLVACIGAVLYSRRPLTYAAFVIPLFFLVELATGMTIEHANLWYQSLAEWKRALIMAAVFLGTMGAMAGGVYWYVVSSPRF
jgi:hypothetical protein